MQSQAEVKQVHRLMDKIQTATEENPFLKKSGSHTSLYKPLTIDQKECDHFTVRRIAHHWECLECGQEFVPKKAKKNVR